MGWFAAAFLATSVLALVAALIWFEVIRVLPLMYQTATRIEHVQLYHRMQEDVTGFLEQARPDKVLDVGAGTGYLSLPLSRFLYVVGLDASKDMIEYAHHKARKLKSSFQPVVGMAEALPFRDQTFGAVVCSFALHHFANLTESLLGMMRTLKVGGQLIIMDIGGGTLVSELHRIVTDQLFRMLSGQNWQGHYYIDFDVLKQWLQYCGMDVKTVATYHHPIPRKLIHLEKTGRQPQPRPFHTFYRYGMGVSDEAKAMMLRAQAARLRTRKLHNLGYYPMLVRPFLEILAGNLYLGKKLFAYGAQHLGINLSEGLINTVDALSFYKARLAEEPEAAAARVKQFALEKGADMCGIVDMDIVRERTSVALAPFASRALILAKSTLNFEDSGRDVWEVYTQLTRISNQVAGFIRRQYGFSARCLFPFALGLYYPQMAQAGGLGWKGLNNLLVTEKYGAKVRLSAVFTDMPLACDREYNKDLCAACLKYCMTVCPVGAIGHRNFSLEKCINYFSRAQGCGLCVGVCPYFRELASAP